MAGEVDHQAAEARGAEALGDGQVVFLLAVVAVKQDHGAADLAPGLQRGMPPFQQGAHDAAFFRFAGGARGGGEQAGDPGGAGVGSDFHAEAGGVVEDLPLVGLQSPPLGAEQVIGAPDRRGKEGHEGEEQGKDREASERFFHFAGAGWTGRSETPAGEIPMKNG